MTAVFIGSKARFHSGLMHTAFFVCKSNEILATWMKKTCVSFLINIFVYTFIIHAIQLMSAILQIRVHAILKWLNFHIRFILEHQVNDSWQYEKNKLLSKNISKIFEFNSPINHRCSITVPVFDVNPQFSFFFKILTIGIYRYEWSVQWGKKHCSIACSFSVNCCKCEHNILFIQDR